MAKQGALVATGAIYYAYDEQGRLLDEYDAAGAALQETVYLGNMPVAVSISVQEAAVGKSSASGWRQGSWGQC